MAYTSPLSRFVVLLAVIALISACNQQGTGTQSGTPFIGGQTGVEVTFATNAPPSETYDGGSSPFDIVVQTRNKGEYALPKEKVLVSVIGINPEEFAMTSAGLSKNPPEELVPRRKDVQNNIVESNVVMTSFTGLNHKSGITGTELTFPITAKVCYGYGTIAAAQLCVRSDILNPSAGGVCEISGTKTLYNSGAPLQVENLVESPRARNKIGFTFGIKQVDVSGNLFQKDSKCDQTVRSNADKVFVDVKSLAGDIECQGLTGGTKSSNGFVQLYDKTKTVTCIQTIGAPGDYTFPVTIEITYDFQSTVSANLVVKHAETSSN